MMTSRFSTASILLVIVLVFVSGVGANAGIWGPSNKEECIQEYATEAVTDFATGTLRNACNTLFQDTSFDYYLELEIVKKDGVLITPNQAISIAVAEGRSKEKIHAGVKQHYNEWKKEKNKRKIVANCLIKSKTLYKAQNKNAAAIAKRACEK